MLPTAATALSALQKCFPLQPQHSQLCRNASHCSHSTLSFAEMLPTAATALSAKCKNTQIPKFCTDHFSSFVCSCVLHTIAISQPRKGDPTLRRRMPDPIRGCSDLSGPTEMFYRIFLTTFRSQRAPTCHYNDLIPDDFPVPASAQVTKDDFPIPASAQVTKDNFPVPAKDDFPVPASAQVTLTGTPTLARCRTRIFRIRIFQDDFAVSTVAPTA